jgi:hypothetical protein
MEKEQENTEITEKDLLFIEKEFSKSNKPLSPEEMTKKMAYQKTASQLVQEVKKYDPLCTYEIGDLIYKEYDEPLMVSSKGVEPFKGAVVLSIVGKAAYEDFNCEMLEVDYSGGGIFRKYIDYMKKTKTQVLLPSNVDGKAKTPEKIEKKKDPRLSELPMTDRDLKTLEKNLKSALSKSSKFFCWNNYWQLNEKRMEIQEKKIKEIKNHLLEKKLSAASGELVDKFFNMESTNDLFELCCMSLNFILEKKYKKDFIYVSPQEWGKWHLKKILNSLPENLPLSAPKAKLPAFGEAEKEEATQIRDFPLQTYLTWREILSGGIKITKSLNKALSLSREYIFTDKEEEKDYTVFYYPSSAFFLGLRDFFESNNVPQGARLTLERKGPTQFNFWLKKSKKKLPVLKIDYDPKEDKFTASGEEAFTFSLPNKIIHLKRETLSGLLSLYPQRDDLELRELLVLIFKNFGLESNNFALHYLRAYHLVDILKQTTQEEVEKTLLNSPGFYPSEKNKGVFFYREKIEVEEEVKPAVPAEIVPEAPPPEEIEEAPPVTPPSEAPAKEIPAPEIREERKEEIRVKAPLEPLKDAITEKEEIEKLPVAKREKVLKKKKLRMEGDRVRRARKGEKRIIEEKIEIEESEQEAFRAIKAEEKKEAAEEVRAKEKKGKFKPYVSEEPVFGVFAEKLKTALDKTKKKKK